MKIVANGLKSTHLPSKVSTLYGCLYLLEAAIPEVNKLLVPALTEFLVKNIGTVSKYVFFYSIFTCIFMHLFFGSL